MMPMIMTNLYGHISNFKISENSRAYTMSCPVRDRPCDMVVLPNLIAPYVRQ